MVYTDVCVCVCVLYDVQEVFWVCCLCISVCSFGLAVLTVLC